MNFKINFTDLIRDAHKYQYSDIAATKEQNLKNKPKCYFTKNQWFILAFSPFFAALLECGFSDNFAGYIISGLSLFVGIFFTFLISIFEKFSDINFNQYSKTNSIEKNAIGRRLQNFFKMITVMSIYVILVGLVNILLLSLTLLFEGFELKINFSYIFHCYKAISNTEYLNYLFVFVYRSLVIYFLISFLYHTIFLLSTFYDFFIGFIKDKSRELK